MTLYIPRSSPLHTLPTSLKLLVLVVAGAGIWGVENLWVLLGLLVISGLLIALAKLPWRAIAAQLQPTLLLLFILFLLQSGSAGWVAGLVLVLRFTILVTLASLVSLTTRTTDLLAVLEQGFQPLRWLGIDPAQVSLTLAMSMRFIPVLLSQFQAIQEAQRARGLDRHIVALLVPFLVKMLRMADELSDALDARGYGD